MRGVARKPVTLLALVLALVLAGVALLASFGAAHRVRSSSRVPSSRVTVLGYHAIADHSGDPVLADFSVPPALFARQLDTLQRCGWSFVDLDTALAALNGEGEVPRKAALVTFDDAYTDLLEVACPILEERGIPAVAFAVAEETGGTNAWDVGNGARRLDLLDGEGLREASARGIEIGSHTATHPPLTEVAEGSLDAELEGSADRLEGLGLPRPRAFAYPYGLWNRRVAAAVQGAGYEVAFAVERGVVDGGSDRYALPRIAVHADDSGRKLHWKMLAAGWPEWLHRSLRRLARRSPGGDRESFGQDGAEVPAAPRQPTRYRA